MNDMQIGSVMRAIRKQRNSTQVELARAAGVSAATVSRVERGDLEWTSLGTVRRMFAAVGARIEVMPRWRGADLDRLLDARHAAITEAMVRRLMSLPVWTVEPEATFSIFGERGSIDILAWHSDQRALLIVEIKGVIGDVGGLVRQVDRYRRLSRDVARERGWHPRVTGVWVVVADGRTARRRLAEHRATLKGAFPADGHAMEHWLHELDDDKSGLSFVPIPHPENAARRQEGRS
jgi:transcriptional regulator with XRE-family HTH domain